MKNIINFILSSELVLCKKDVSVYMVYMSSQLPGFKGLVNSRVKKGSQFNT